MGSGSFGTRDRIVRRYGSASAKRGGDENYIADQVSVEGKANGEVGEKAHTKELCHLPRALRECNANLVLRVLLAVGRMRHDAHLAARMSITRLNLVHECAQAVYIAGLLRGSV